MIIKNIDVPEIVCPYCGYENGEEKALLEMEKEIQCAECDKVFSYSTTILYSTFKSE